VTAKPPFTGGESAPAVRWLTRSRAARVPVVLWLHALLIPGGRSAPGRRIPIPRSRRPGRQHVDAPWEQDKFDFRRQMHPVAVNRDKSITTMLPRAGSDDPRLGPDGASWSVTPPRAASK